MVAVTALGLAAAFLFALSAFLQQRAARTSVGAGLVILLTVDASPLTGDPHRNRVLMATVCVVSLVLLLRQMSRHTYPWLAGLLIGVAAGLCHALNAVYLKLTVEDLFRGGVLGTLSDWPVYALTVTALSGMLLVQIAFASGPLPPAVAAMSVTNPVASFVLGILAFDAPAPRDPVVLSAIAVSGVLIALGVVGWPTRRAPGGCTGRARPNRSQPECADR